MPGPLGLAMIVKDEAHAIGRTLESVRGICYPFVVCDTGSTDDTAKVALDAGALVLHFPFVDYAQARNRALDLHAEHPDAARWVLSLSADEALRGGEALVAHLEAYSGDESAFLVEVRTPTGSFPYPRVLRTGGPWRYVGEVHEQPRHRDDPSREPAGPVPGCWIEYAPTDPARFAARLRERDLPLLERQLSTATATDDRARVMILLAQTREQVAVRTDDPALASQEWFAAFGWYAFVSRDKSAPPEARGHALWRALNVAEILSIYHPHEMVARLRPIAESDPDNPAVAYMLAAHTAAMNPKEGLHAAYRAARIARAAVKDPEHPHDPHGLLWRGHHLAAACARALGHGPAMKKSAAAGIEAGGDPEMFKEFT